HAGFGNERERAPVTLRPVGQGREQSLDVALVANKVIVNDENRPAPADPQQRVQLGQRLLIALRAGDAAIDLDDVAELALKGTAARVLDRHRAVASEVCNMKVRYGRRGERRPLGGLVDAFRDAALEVANELRQGRLRLAEEDVIDLG